MIKRISERKGHNGSIYQLIGPDAEGNMLSVGGDGWLVKWPPTDPEMGYLVAKVEGGQFFCVQALPGLGAYVAGALDGGLHWLYPEEPERNLHLAHHRKGIYTLLHLGDYLYAGGGDGIISKWSVATGRVTESWPLSNLAIRSLLFDAGNNLIFAGSSNNCIYALDADTLAPKFDWVAHDNSVFCLALSPDGNYLLSGGRDAHIRRWRISAGGAEADLAIPAHNFTVNDLAFSPGGEYLLSASRDKTVKVWDAGTLKLLKVGEGIRDRGHVNSVNSVLWINDDRFYSGGDDRRILEWSIS